MKSLLYPDATIYGPYVHKGQRRSYVIIFRSHQDKQVMLLSRFRMQEHLGRVLEHHEHVDHKDNNERNDALDNLQVLLVAEHNKKTHTKYNDEVDVLCIGCNQLFTMDRKRQYKEAERKKLKRNGPYCSRTCINSHRGVRPIIFKEG